MGSQQLLLLLVGVIILGIAVTVGVFMFINQSQATNRDAISNELVQLAAQAQKYYRKPATIGGGNSSFGGLTLDRVTSEPINANGEYSLTPDPAPQSATSITITGTGRETGSDGSTNILMTMTVWPDSILIVATN